MNDHFAKQIYRQPDDGTGKPRYFHVADMVNFAQKNLKVEGVKADLEKALGLIDAGIVDSSHLKNVDFDRFSPIVMCCGATSAGENLIVDGNHRYVAATISISEQGLDGVIPGYLLEREQWEPFIVPPHLVSQMELTDPQSA